MNFVPTTKYTPGYSPKRAPLAKGVGVFFLFERSTYQKNVIFQGILGGAINKPLLRTAFVSPWDSRGRNFSDFIKKEKWRKYRPKTQSGTSQEVPIFVEPTHTIKTQGGKRFLSQSHRSNFIQNYTKNEISTDIHGFWCTMVDFELSLARVCDTFRVTIRNLLHFSIEVSISFPGCILFP